MIQYIIQKKKKDALRVLHSWAGEDLGITNYIFYPGSGIEHQDFPKSRG